MPPKRKRVEPPSTEDMNVSDPLCCFCKALRMHLKEFNRIGSKYVIVHCEEPGNAHVLAATLTAQWSKIKSTCLPCQRFRELVSQVIAGGGGRVFLHCKKKQDRTHLLEVLNTIVDHDEGSDESAKRTKTKTMKKDDINDCKYHLLVLCIYNGDFKDDIVMRYLPYRDFPERLIRLFQAESGERYGLLNEDVGMIRDDDHEEDDHEEELHFTISFGKKTLEEILCQLSEEKCYAPKMGYGGVPLDKKSGKPVRIVSVSHHYLGPRIDLSLC